ncbi:DUF4097 family beta strand repeat-containing protein [Candidatus Latescibacterota bacterium]
MIRYFSSILIIIAFFTGFESVSAREKNINSNYTIDSGSIDINIDIDFGELEIIPSSNSKELRVKIEYNDRYCDIVMDHNKRKNRFTIKTDQEWFSDDGHRKHNNSKRGVEIVIELPYGPETDLYVHLKAGEADIQFGGLSLRNFEFENFAGDVDIDFNKPNRINLERFDIDCKVGNLVLNNLGNAHFRDAKINSSIGALSVDFSGDILDDVTADIDFELGETDITIPSEIGARMRISKFMLFSSEAHYNCFDKKGSTYYSDNYDDCDKLLYLTVSSGLGGVDVRMK